MNNNLLCPLFLSIFLFVAFTVAPLEAVESEEKGSENYQYSDLLAKIEKEMVACRDKEGNLESFALSKPLLNKISSFKKQVRYSLNDNTINSNSNFIASVGLDKTLNIEKKVQLIALIAISKPRLLVGDDINNNNDDFSRWHSPLLVNRTVFEAFFKPVNLPEDIGFLQDIGALQERAWKKMMPFIPELVRKAFNVFNFNDYQKLFGKFLTQSVKHDLDH